MRPDKLLFKEKKKKKSKEAMLANAQLKDAREAWRNNFDLTKIFFGNAISYNSNLMSRNPKKGSTSMLEENAIGGIEGEGTLRSQSVNAGKGNTNEGSTLLNNALNLLNNNNTGTGNPSFPNNDASKMTLENMTTYSTNTNKPSRWEDKRNMKDCVDSLEDWRGLKAHFRTSWQGKENMSRDFDMFFWGVSRRRVPSPPMSIIFSKVVGLDLFYAKVDKTIKNPAKSIEIGGFRAFKTTFMKKMLNKKHSVLCSKLDSGSLYLFTTEQWPLALRTEDIESKMTSEDLYCLFCFKNPEIPAEQLDMSVLNKRDSVSVLDFENDCPKKKNKKLKGKKNIFEVAAEKSGMTYLTNPNETGMGGYGDAAGNSKDQDLSTSINNIINGIGGKGNKNQPQFPAKGAPNKNLKSFDGANNQWGPNPKGGNSNKKGKNFNNQNMFINNNRDLDYRDPNKQILGQQKNATNLNYQTQQQRQIAANNYNKSFNDYTKDSNEKYFPNRSNNNPNLYPGNPNGQKNLDCKNFNGNQQSLEQQLDIHSMKNSQGNYSGHQMMGDPHPQQSIFNMNGSGSMTVGTNGGTGGGMGTEGGENLGQSLIDKIETTSMLCGRDLGGGGLGKGKSGAYDSNSVISHNSIGNNFSAQNLLNNLAGNI